MFIPTFAFAAWGNLYLFIVFPCRETICFSKFTKNNSHINHTDTVMFIF